MNPDSIASQSQSAHRLRVLPSLQPKRRCKTAPVPPEEEPADSVIIPFYNPAHKPTRLHRSAQPFQVWKEAKPHWHDGSARKSEGHTSLTESLHAFARIVTGPWHVNPSP